MLEDKDITEEFKEVLDFEKRLSDEFGIPIILGDLVRTMIPLNPAFTVYCVEKVVGKWGQQDFDTPQEGIRNINAMCYGIAVALDLQGHKFKPEDYKHLENNKPNS